MNGGDNKRRTAEDKLDPSIEADNPTDLRIASEILSNWLPFLCKGLCDNCAQSITDRIRSLHPVDSDAKQLKQEDEQHVSTLKCRDLNGCTENQDNCDSNWIGSWKDGTDINDTEDRDSLGSWKDGANGELEHIEQASESERIQSQTQVKSPRPRMSWADMAQEDELEAEEEGEVSRQSRSGSEQLGGSGGEVKVNPKPELSRERRERIRFMNVKRKKDFICLERVNGKIVNILGGLELHYSVFSAVEQKKMVDYVYELQEKGKKGELEERTYTAPQKWMKGKGRVTLQFGCCYNYAIDRDGNPPGILQHGLVDPIPHLFKLIIKRLVKWHVLPPTCVPDSCIVNIYEQGDCIPPHIDNHDFLRPFCTVSFLSECNILFGTNLKIEGPGEFSGSIAIPLPVGSVLVLNGNGADVAKHCVPAVPTKRISITFRKMDESKWPVGFVPEPDLHGLQPLVYEADKPTGSNTSKPAHSSNRQSVKKEDRKDHSRGLLGPQPRFHGQTRHQGPSPGNRRRARLEY